MGTRLQTADIPRVVDHTVDAQLWRSADLALPARSPTDLESPAEAAAASHGTGGIPVRADLRCC